VAVSKIETQAKILQVENARGRVSIEADISALGQYPTRFIRWAGQGNAPPIGAEVLATMEPTVRQARFVRDGTFAADEIDGEEMPWQVNWAMLGAKPLEGASGAGTDDTAGMPPPSPSVAPSAAGKAVYVDANLRHRVDAMSINDREAVRLAIAYGASEGGNIFGDIDEVLRQAGTIAGWLNTRFGYRMGGEFGSSLVTHAQSLGAVVTDVEVVPEAEAVPEVTPDIKNEAELRAWVEAEGWSREAVVEVISSAGYESASAYLAAAGNTPPGLASLLSEKLA